VTAEDWPPETGVCDHRATQSRAPEW